jgi:acyl carrier protein
MGTFSMPSLGADMEAGTLVEWLKHPGDRVKRGDIVAVVETQKGAIEVEVFEDGVIERMLVEPIDPGIDLREALDIDSMDFLNFITALHKRLRAAIPEADYPKLFTINDAVDYLASKLPTAAG